MACGDNQKAGGISQSHGCVRWLALSHSSLPNALAPAAHSLRPWGNLLGLISRFVSSRTCLLSSFWSHCSSAARRTVPGDWLWVLPTLTSTLLCSNCSSPWGLVGKAARNHALEAPISFSSSAKTNEHKVPLSSKVLQLNSPLFSEGVSKTFWPQYCICNCEESSIECYSMHACIRTHTHACIHTYIHIYTHTMSGLILFYSYHNPLFRIYIVREFLEHFPLIQSLLCEMCQALASEFALNGSPRQPLGPGITSFSRSHSHLSFFGDQWYTRLILRDFAKEVSSTTHILSSL